MDGSVILLGKLLPVPPPVVSFVAKIDDGNFLLSQCRQDPNLDSIDRDADPPFPPTSVPIPLVSFEFGRPAQDESLYPSGSLGLVK